LAGVCGAALLGSAYWRPVHFLDERIEADIHPESITITGTYHYKNTSVFPRIELLQIPFPSRSDWPPPFEVAAGDAKKESYSLKIFRVFGEYHLPVFFAPHGERHVRIRYSQKTPLHEGCYLITTTLQWKRPLEKADFVARMHGVRLVKSNYALETLTGNTLGFSRIRFMPQEDWIFKWEVL